MFTLLLSTDKRDISTLYSTYPDWKAQGFEDPVITSTAEEAIKLLSERRFDAVSSLLPLDEGRKLFGILRAYDTIGMQIAHDEAQLHREIAVTRRELLSREKERQVDSEEENLNVIFRHEFISSLLRGEICSKEEIDKNIAIMHEMLNPAFPVATSSVRLPEAENFTRSRWKYGKERFHNALRNVFEQDTENMNFVMAAVSEHHIRILGYATQKFSKEQTYMEMLNYVKRVRHMVNQIFDMPLIIRRVNAYSDLYAFSEENADRFAH